MPSGRASAADVETLASAMVQTLAQRRIHLSGCAKREGGSLGSGVRGRQQRPRRAAASPWCPTGRNQTDACLHQADVGLGVGLAARGVQADLRAAPRVRPNGAATRPRAELDRSGHLLEVVNPPASSSHSPPARQQQLHQIGPTEKFSWSLAITKPAKSRTASESGFSTAEIIASTSPPMAFLSECSSIQPIRRQYQSAKRPHSSGPRRLSAGSPQPWHGREPREPAPVCLLPAGSIPFHPARTTTP